MNFKTIEQYMKNQQLESYVKYQNWKYGKEYWLSLGFTAEESQNMETSSLWYANKERQDYDYVNQTNVITSKSLEDRYFPFETEIQYE